MKLLKTTKLRRKMAVVRPWSAVNAGQTMNTHGNVDDGVSDGECILSFMQEIVEHVFMSLPVKELNKCCRVCSLWRDMAIKVKNKRKFFTWFCSGEPKKTSPKKTTQGIADDLKDFLQNIPVEPSYALVFSSTKLFESSVSVPSSTCSERQTRKSEKLPLESYLSRVLPSSCEIIGPVTNGIAGTEGYAYKSRELENTKALSCLFLPRLPNIKLYPFVINADTYWRLMEKKLDQDILHEILSLPEEASPNVVLFFHAQQFVYSVDIVSALVKTFPNIIVCGGYTDHLLPSSCVGIEERENVVTGISFCGSGVKMASVIIDKYVVEVKEIERHLMTLKNTRIPEHNSVCFMFACMGRGYYHYNKDNVESQVFRKIFPKTPLFGFFGNGEIGYDYLPDYSNDDPHKGAPVVGQSEDDDDETSPHSTLYHAYTTVFCMVSLE